jgi:DNA-binding MarR family transcriptional regulator
MDTEQNQPPPNPNIDSAAEHLLDVVPRLMRLIASEAQASGISGALTVSQLRALGLLAREPRLPSELARELKITPATASEVADLLVRRGLVERSAMPEDRRLTLLRITLAGETLHQAARQRTLGALRRVLHRLDTPSLAALECGLAGLLALSQQKPSRDEHVG